jgi:hypothetical protein
MLRNHIDQRCGVSVSESGSWSSWKLSGSQCLSSAGVQDATGVEEICALRLRVCLRESPSGTGRKLTQFGTAMPHLPDVDFYYIFVA